jgi:hypothetical protein
MEGQAEKFSRRRSISILTIRARPAFAMEHIFFGVYYEALR